MPDFPQGQVGVPGFRVARREVGLGGVRQAEVGAQDIDAGLAQVAGGGVVGGAGQGVYAAKADRGRVVAELGDSRSEAFRVQAGCLAQGAVLVYALASVGDDQGDQGAGPGDDPERQLHQVEQRLGIDAVLGLQPARTEQVPPGVEDGGGHEHRGGEGQDEHGADRPQAQAAPFRPAPERRYSHTRS
ncbi:hypothetical protein ACFQ0G_43100 [Streptomyces chiangmaiensis]